MTLGIYHLIIYLSFDKEIRIGKLGLFLFPAGYYVYTGSAMQGLEARVARHKRKQKKLHWHIDFLLQYAEIINVITYQTKERLECCLNSKIMSISGSQIIAKGFGSSDCGCITHLFFFDKKPDIYITL